MQEALGTGWKLLLEAIPFWLGVSGWALSLVLICQGERTAPVGSKVMEIPRHCLILYLTIALVLGAAITLVFKAGLQIGKS